MQHILVVLATCALFFGAEGTKAEFEKRFDHAQKAYNRGCVQGGSRVNDWRQKAKLRQEALEQLHATLKIAPLGHAWRAHNLFYLANCYEHTPEALTQGRLYYEKLFDFLADADQSMPQVKELLMVAHSNMARLQVMQQSAEKMTDWNRMVLHAKKAHDLQPTDAEGQLQYSLALIMADKNLKTAKKLLKKAENAGALRSPSEFVRIGQALANCTTAKYSNWKLAKQYMEKGRKQFPTSAYLAYQLGRMAQLLGDDYDKLARTVVLPNLRSVVKQF
jgi:hypothetical protein